MKYQLSDGNIIIATPDYINSHHPDAVPVYEEPVDPTPIGPQVVTMRQARLALLSIGLLDQIETAIDAMDEPERTIAKIEWDYSSEVHRDKPFVNSLGATLGLDDEAIDALFAAAALID